MTEKTDKNDFWEHHRRLMKFRQLTDSQILQKYYQFGIEISQQEKLGFMLEGGVKWESENPDGIDFSGISLKSKLHDPIGKHILDNPLTNYRQSQLGLYEIAGTIETKFDVENIEDCLESISKSVEKIALLNATISFNHNARIDWKPARILKFINKHIDPPKSEKIETTEFWDVIALNKDEFTNSAIILKDEHIANSANLFNAIINLPDEHRKTFHTALLWYCEGLKTGYEVSSFNSYWNAVEILAFKYFNKWKLKSADEVKIEKIQKKLEAITTDNCIKTIGECSKIINESIPDKFCNVFGMFMPKEEIINMFFKKLGDSKYSLYSIRNYISHGNVTEIEFDKHSTFKNHVYKMSQASKQIILLMISNIDKLKIN